MEKDKKQLIVATNSLNNIICHVEIPCIPALLHLWKVREHLEVHKFQYNVT